MANLAKLVVFSETGDMQRQPLMSLAVGFRGSVETSDSVAKGLTDIQGGISVVSQQDQWQTEFGKEHPHLEPHEDPESCFFHGGPVYFTLNPS